MIRMYSDLGEHAHETAADLAVQAEIANALFQTKVHRMGGVVWF
jgi:hypothetical protein